MRLHICTLCLTHLHTCPPHLLCRSDTGPVPFISCQTIKVSKTWTLPGYNPLPGSGPGPGPAYLDQLILKVLKPQISSTVEYTILIIYHSNHRCGPLNLNLKSGFRRRILSSPPSSSSLASASWGRRHQNTVSCVLVTMDAPRYLSDPPPLVEVIAQWGSLTVGNWGHAPSCMAWWEGRNSTL